MWFVTCPWSSYLPISATFIIADARRSPTPPGNPSSSSPRNPGALGRSLSEPYRETGRTSIRVMHDFLTGEKDFLTSKSIVKQDPAISNVQASWDQVARYPLAPSLCSPAKSTADTSRALEVPATRIDLRSCGYARARPCRGVAPLKSPQRSLTSSSA